MKRRLKVHKEGYAILFSLLTLLVAVNVIVFIQSPNRILSVVCLIISILAYSFFLYFFRNPTREIEINDENLVIAPADGHIVVTEPTEEWEYFDGKNVPEYIAAVEPYLCEAPSEIETETAYVDCKIKMAIFYDGLKEAPEVIDSCIFLSEEQYVNLLEWQLDNRHSNYNDLASKNFELFKVVNDKARARFNYGGIPYDNTPTFTIELTSIQEDAYALFGEPSICGDIFESYIDQIAEHSYLSIENRVISFFYEAMNDDKWIEYTEVNKIDAIAESDLEAYLAYCRRFIAGLMEVEDIMMFPVSAKEDIGVAGQLLSERQ